jgi:protein-S-isoprenylcysteine O-methyltransferase Ste14
VHGPYWYVRNPMYLAVLAVVTGQALLLGRPVLLGYATGVGAAFIGFAYGYEQRALAQRYGARYQADRRAVPGWWPRLRPAQIPRLDLAACPLGPRPGRRQTARSFSSPKMTG